MSSELRYAVAPITHVDVRDTSGTGDNTWTMQGYAAVFNQETTLLDSKFLRLTESVAPSFFDRVLEEQPMSAPAGVVHFNFGHDMNRAVAATDVARNQPGSLELRADAHGLHFRAKVARDDPDGVAMASKMRTGVIRQASFAFTIRSAEYTTIESEDGPDTEHRTLLDCEHLYDVCATPQGAYSSTVAGLRSYSAALDPVGLVFEGGSSVGSDPEGAAAEAEEDPVLVSAGEALALIRNAAFLGGFSRR